VEIITKERRKSGTRESWIETTDYGEIGEIKEGIGALSIQWLIGKE